MIDQEKQKKIDAIWGTAPVVSSSTEVAKNRVAELKERSRLSQTQGDTGLKGFATGVGQDILSTIKGAGQIGEKIGQGALGLIEKTTGLPVTSESVYSEEALKKSAEEGGAMGKLLREENLEAKSTSEKAGKFVSSVAQFAIPATKITKAQKVAETAGKTFNYLQKVFPRMVASGGVAAAQEGEIGKGSAIAAGAEAVLPGAGKIISWLGKKPGAISRRLLKGFGADIETIGDNPQAMKDALKNLTPKSKQELVKVAETNARAIRDGIAQVRKDARTAYGEAVQTLKSTDIKPDIFRKATQALFDKFGSVVKSGKRVLNNVEFSNPSLVKKANTALNKITDTKLDGFSLNKTMKAVEEMAFKTTGSDAERLAFNAFIRDLSKGLKGAITKSTDKLDDINKLFSKDMQLVETMESIFGKVQYKNEKELYKVFEKLKSGLNKTDIGEDAIDRFLTKIGEAPDKFRATESARRILTEPMTPGKAGSGILETIVNTSAGILEPKDANRLAIGLEELSRTKGVQVIEKIAQGIEMASDVERPIIIKTLLNLFQETSD